ncbi:hypothetical protein [Serratia marcescens]|uniref:hypothetical protein n=1 Tax=Serratia marcescens TaxID=615 RepID=UPI001EF8E5AC|nr:hypothetical protein [Serratia marcescens]WAY97228.1 hypothetical protein O3T13_01335 [Serratia marcescens]
MSLPQFHPSSHCGKAALWLAAAEVLLIVAWSSGFVGIRFAADYAPVLLVAFWRSVVVAFALRVARHDRLPDRRQQRH